jgi:hypothetical protein
MSDYPFDDLVELARDALEELIMSGDDMIDRIEDLEAKLAKAVGLVDDMLEWGTWYGEALAEIRQRLAELKGESDESC